MPKWWRGLTGCFIWLVACCGDDCGGVDSAMDTPPGDNSSCTRLPATCGANANDSCCSSPEVAGGMYLRSYDAAGSGTMSFPAMISTFRFDRYEITVGRFRAFVQAGQGTQDTPPAAAAGEHPNLTGSGWNASWGAKLVATTAALVAAVKCDAVFQTWTDAPAGNETRPINCITWYEAMAFCIWDGGFLASEAEWNYAAAGGAEQRAYPWSSPASSLSIDDTRTSYLDGGSCVGDGMPACTLTDLIAVGTKPAGDGLWTHADLAGNVQEWGFDYGNAYQLPCVDCASLDVADVRVVRGGNFRTAATSARTGRRGSLPPENRYPDVGARCARSR